MKTNSNYKQRLANITTFIFDVDGVFTNGEIYFHESGETIRSLNTKDGYAIETALEAGYKIAIISRSDSQLVKKAFAKVGINDVFLSARNKGKIFNNYLKNKQLTTSQILFMGDDIPDYDCLNGAGIGTCPRDAVREVREIADYVSTFDGGNGAVRDVIEQTMRVQGKWFVPTV